MPDIHPLTSEEADAQKVDAAIQAIQQGQTAEARRLLAEVIANTPESYVHQFEDEDALVVKFWDVTEFIHYVTLHKGSARERKVIWRGSAYPRAHYYLGFLEVSEGNFARAVEVLEAGERLEPNVQFLIEKAQVFVRGFHNYEKALALYDRVLKQGPQVPGDQRAVAMRGMGFALIELAHLDLAEGYFRESLHLNPDNHIAVNELKYIEQLRAGGGRVPTKVVTSSPLGPLACTLCAEPFQGGKVLNRDGRLIYVCKRCHRKTTKRWWQFWK